MCTLVYDQVGQTEHESVLAAGQFAHESVSVYCQANKNNNCISYINKNIYQNIQVHSTTHLQFFCPRRFWRHQRGNQNSQIEEGQTTQWQTTQWPKEKEQKDKQWSTKQ